MTPRTLPERIADGEPLPPTATATARDLTDALVLLTHRLHDVTEDHGERSRQADDLRARRRRVRDELEERAS